MVTVDPLHPDAEAFGAFRILKNGTGRAYTVMAGPWGLLEQTLRMARAFGFVADTDSEERYAVLDVYGADDVGIIQDYSIPTARAFKWWKRKVGWRVKEYAA